MPETPSGPTDPIHPEIRRERTDADVRTVLLFGVVLVLAAVFAHLVLWGLFRGLERGDKARQPRLPPVAQELPRFPRDLDKIPEPRLQERDVDDLRILQAREKAQLETPVAWVDQKKGIVRVPIEEAMQLLADPEIAAANGARTLPDKGKKP